MAQDYNATLNLPKTDFPMRAGLPKQEPELLKEWESAKLYYKMAESTKGKPGFSFHDGPPYANAAIHLGTAFNKVLKDIIIRQKNMSGYHAPYIPGWDTHGLPIELKAIQEYGVGITSDPVTLRKHCHDFALSHVETQKQQFKRLGTLADYDDPYLTLRPDYEARQIEIFGSMAQKGYIYRDLKSVHWCPKCVTALAEAEIEYADDEVDSIYVKFNVVEDKNNILSKMGAKDLAKTYVVIWTTTTWTLPANLASTLGPEFEYVVVLVNDEYLLMAKELVNSTMKAAKNDNYEILGSAKGSELEFVMYKHPFLDRVSPLIVGDHVTLESGTGIVHTAPGHGVEDFDVIMNYYPDLGVVVPVDDHGNMTAEAGEWLKGVSTNKANELILTYIKDHNNLLALEHIVHQYPHCWRCQTPILFRATEQWFCSVDDFKDQALSEIDKVNFLPEWGKLRLSSMVADRNAWAISRQRAWGVPIPIFRCNQCEKYIINEETITHIIKIFAKEGTDSWFINDEKYLLPEGFTCPHCENKDDFTKETDTMDVWFDSGCSYHAALHHRELNEWPVDLYLEGGDQHRGWFQSSLLTAIAWQGKAPYKNVITHGMVVDGDGRKMSKSLGNGIAPEELVDKYGADILRLWVASVDYRVDIRISDDILKQLSESYRKIRNTARFILSNINDFHPDTDRVEYNKLEELDKWAITKLNTLIDSCNSAYKKYDFHVVYHNILNFCTVDMSNFYLDIIKDRLYVEKANEPKRKSAQTAIYDILKAITLIVAPILSFTSEEIWKFMPHSNKDNTEFAVLNQIPKTSTSENDEFMNRWNKIANIRGFVNKALEDARTEKVIGKSLEAKITLYCKDEMYEFAIGIKELLKTVFIVSDVEVLKYEGQELVGEDENFAVKVTPAVGGKCERCWTINPTVGANKNHETLCERCSSIVG